MSNWVRGQLIVKGTYDNVKRFLVGTLKGGDLEIIEEAKKLQICSKEEIYIEGTNRNFILDSIELKFDTEELINEYTLKEFMAAWSIKPEPYVQMSKAYQVDIYVYGVEIYGGFTQVIEIQKGEIIIDKMEKINMDFRDEEFIDEGTISCTEDLNFNDGISNTFIDELDDILPF